MKKDIEVEKIIKSFIDQVRDKVPAIKKIMYEYNDSIHTYSIWHDLVPDDENKYRKELGTLIYDYLFENDIYDVSFAYNPEKFPKENIKPNEDIFFIEHNTNTKCPFLEEDLHPMSVTIMNAQPFLIKNDIIVSSSQSNIQQKNISTRILFDDILLKAAQHEQWENCGQERLAA